MAGIIDNHSVFIPICIFIPFYKKFCTKGTRCALVVSVQSCEQRDVFLLLCAAISGGADNVHGPDVIDLATMDVVAFLRSDMVNATHLQNYLFLLRSMFTYVRLHHLLSDSSQGQCPLKEPATE